LTNKVVYILFHDLLRPRHSVCSVITAHSLGYTTDRRRSWNKCVKPLSGVYDFV